MREDNKRLGTAFGVAVAVHLVAALLISLFGYRFVTRPPEILEVALIGGGGGGAPEEVEEQQEEKSILRSLDDIIDKRLKPETKKTVTKKPVQKSENKNPNPNPNPSTNANAEGKGEGPGSGGGSGSGTGTGVGDGQGENSGRGVPVTPPRLVSAPQPKYPSSARNAGVEGIVGVKMLVNTDGKVEEAFVVRSSGNGALDEAAVAAVYKWRFNAAKDKFGQKARCYVTQGIRFDLRK